MKNAIIKITDRHLQDGEEYTSELTTAGEFEADQNGCKIVYKETDEELLDCITTLTADTGRVSMLRSGRYNTEMIIELERRHSCYYTTPYGEMLMGIYCRFIENKITESGGTLRFAYTIDFNNIPASENELEITVTEKTQEE
ncbi:MAG: DUF1934 domain-containing protein [Clostridia bacterium]|nr:DUF1934 domain-containing protein [Clostridia bacterium]